MTNHQANPNAPNHGDVVAFNYLKNTLTIYGDSYKAALNEGLSKNEIKRMLNSRRIELLRGVSVKYLNNNSIGPFLARTTSEIKRSFDKEKKGAVELIVYNHCDGTETTFTTVKEASEYTNVSVAILAKRLKEGDIWPTKGYSIRRSNDKRIFPVLNPDELWVNLHRKNASTFGYRVDDGRTATLHLTLDDVGKYIGVSGATVQSKLAEGEGDAYYDHYRITSLARK